MEPLGKGDLAKYHTPLDETEARERFVLLEDPDGGRVLVEGVCDLPIKPTKVVQVAEITRA